LVQGPLTKTDSRESHAYLGHPTLSMVDFKPGQRNSKLKTPPFCLAEHETRPDRSAFICERRRNPEFDPRGRTYFPVVARGQRAYQEHGRSVQSPPVSAPSHGRGPDTGGRSAAQARSRRFSS